VKALPQGLKPVCFLNVGAGLMARSTGPGSVRKERPVAPTSKMRTNCVAGDGGATLMEFAFTLPILVVVLYGIFDFGSALNLKQKLEHAVYEAARTASSQSTADLSNATVGTTGSVADLRDLVARNLTDAGVSDCGLTGAATAGGTNPTTSTWVYNVSGGGCPASLVLTIRRQNVVSVGGVDVFYSRVTLQYPFDYHLSAVLHLVGGAFPAMTNIVVDSSMKNLI